jgi:hypothetical protein
MYMATENVSSCAAINADRVCGTARAVCIHLLTEGTDDLDPAKIRAYLTIADGFLNHTLVDVNTANRRFAFLLLVGWVFIR